MRDDEVTTEMGLTFQAVDINEDRVEDLADMFGDAFALMLADGEYFDDVVAAAIVATIALLADEDDGEYLH